MEYLQLEISHPSHRLIVTMSGGTVPLRNGERGFEIVCHISSFIVSRCLKLELPKKRTPDETERCIWKTSPWIDSLLILYTLSLSRILGLALF